MNQSAWIRPEWNPATIALMVLGFIVFWPLGLAMLAFILLGNRFRGFRRPADFAMNGGFGFGRGRDPGDRYDFQDRSGNTAFDDWRLGELDRIENERRKLDEMRAEFDEYLQELRRAKDGEEFSRFMRDRQGKRDDAQNFGDNR